MVFHYDSSDPLAVVTAPPPDETPDEQAAREEREAEAQRISDQIDEELRVEKVALKKQEHIVKVLLLGQSESDFRMRFARDKWVQERASWRTVLQLNLVRSVNVVLQALQDAFDNDEEEEDPLPFTDRHQLLRLRLLPLRGVESDLKRLLGVKAEDLLENSPQTSPKLSPRTSTEFYVRSRNWRSFLQASQINDSESSRRPIKHDGVSSQDATEVISSCKNDIIALWTDRVVREMLQRYRVRLEDSASLFVSTFFPRNVSSLNSYVISSFLDNAERLATRDYEPSDDDIVRARLRTLDIQEYEMNVAEDGDSRTWVIYDVGGSRTQRNAWLPYFDQVTAIIFLAPISCFDERLQEDPRVNRLEDSFILWKAICSSKLLSRTTLIIFLNKVDVLEYKIANGVMVNRYLPSYGDRPNDTQSVVKCMCVPFPTPPLLAASPPYCEGCHGRFITSFCPDLRQKFKDTVKHSSPEPRMCHIYSTSVIVESIPFPFSLTQFR
ncbi:guanine nucleotide binding protein, alpha subunit [Boletus reticuloceps]|uniref:Guanine nucleotide binding protein, alpha subunit n=1 Tax=Boletus reticuloceps TaxID=495285 RepID=A0A8I2YFA0_9AGAM|nr:guanine nucleotide binding protein, alpha subunit [Boletus reticuloceps]